MLSIISISLCIDYYAYVILSQLASEASPRGEVDGKLRIAANGRMWYIPYVHNPGVLGVFYGHDIRSRKSSHGGR